MEITNAQAFYPTNLAVSAKNVCKSYSNSKPILYNLNLSVKSGTIYSLLGSSGSGKTTLLSCIVGLRSVNSGEIVVFGEKVLGPPGQKMGYMPQELALYGELSIRETIEYYGRLYGMTKADIKERWKWLVDFLKLPTKFKLLSKCSGGQKRRVSLAVTLVHNPALLILDEPTVGLDPVLRESIWEYLRHLSAYRKTTVIVTTHYIEEARCSETIGVLRNCRLLVEQSPTSLLEKYGYDRLEQVVLKLCHFDEEQMIGDKKSNSAKVAIGEIFVTSTNVSIEEHRNSKIENEVSCKSSSFERIRALTTVIWLMLMRHPVFLGTILVLPTTQVIVTLFVVGTFPKNLNFGVINYDTPEFTTCFKPDNDIALWERNLSSSHCNFQFVSCSVLNHLTKAGTFNMVPMVSSELAKQQVMNGNLWGYFTFPENYSLHFNEYVIAGRFSDNETLDGSKINLTMDMSHYLVYRMVLHDAYEGYLNFASEMAQFCGFNPKQFEIPLVHREPVFGNDEFVGFHEYLTPICIMVILLEIPMLVTCLLYMNDLRLGTMERCRVAGIRLRELMISHLVIQCTVIIVQIVIYTLTLWTFWDFQVKGQYWLYFLICILCGVGGEVAGFLLGVALGNEVEALFITFLLGAILVTYAGLLWPWQGMKMWVRYLAYFLPCSLITESLRSVIYRGVGMLHQTVWPGVLIFFTWAVALALISIFVFLRQQKLT